ncbi:hypothetical protein [Anaerotignum sp.]|uniref:hypothetical protein n=1 Tax=Anaerotignum sp. TaxID=2039241 RepID=UPI0033180FBB
MGAYGSPELYPHDFHKSKCPSCGRVGEGKFCSECGTPYECRKYYWSKAGVVVVCISFAIFIACFFAGGKGADSFLLSILIASVACLIGDCICLMLCFFRRKVNRFYLIQALFAIGIGCISFLLFGLICT